MPTTDSAGECTVCHRKVNKYHEPGVSLSCKLIEPAQWRPVLDVEDRIALVDAVGPFAEGEPFDDQEFVDEILLPQVEAIVATALGKERERIAREIQAAKPPHLTRNYTAVDAAYDDAARIARLQ